MHSRFIERMKSHWRSQFIPCTSALVKGWHQVAQAIDRAAEQHKWQVVQLPTGTGKTDALIALCATPNILQHPGALVITRFTAEADKIAQRINSAAGASIALAVHQHMTANANEVAQKPVLVITHSAYRGALREALDRADATYRLDAYHRYGLGTREWTIIDEAFDWVDAYEVDLDELCGMCSALSIHIHDADLCTLSTFANHIKNEINTGRRDQLVAADHLALLRTVNLEHVRLLISDLPTDAVEIWRNVELQTRTGEADAPKLPTTFRKQYVDVLSRLRTIQHIGHGWLSKRRVRTRLHSARSLLSAERACGIILDATAGTDRSYDLLGTKVMVMPRPCNMRSYKNVTIHVSRPHHVGKERLTTQAGTDWPMVAKQLETSLSIEDNVLAITHKDITATVRKRGLKSGKLHVTHWGSLDGKNDWRDCNTIVIYGLPYLDDIAPTNQFLATTESWSSDWFDGQRRGCGEVDMRTAIKNQFIAKSVVQAINRGRPRTIIDDQGNCTSTDVFILLPMGKTGDAVLAAIQKEMPGANILHWRAALENKKPLSRTRTRLLSELKTYGPGSYTKSELIARLSVAPRTFERMSVELQAQGSALMRELAANGVQYHCAIGRGKEARFVKH